MHSSPAIGLDGTIYVGSLDHNVYAINPDGTQKWAFPTGGEVWWSSPAIGSDGTIYVGSFDYNLYAINPDGTQKWAFPTGKEMYSSPAIGSDGTIYVGSDDYNLYAINPNGTQKWVFPTGWYVLPSPAIGLDGTVYIGSHDRHLYAIEGSSGGLADTPWPMFHHDLKHTGRSAGANVGIIAGIVTDSSTGAPIEGATVWADGYSATTDLEGNYQLSVPAGTYDVAASAAGYGPQIMYDITVISGQTTTVDFALEPAKLRYIRQIPDAFTNFDHNLSEGMEEPHVEYLQVILAEEGPDIYPESIVSGYFGSLTEKAVIRFQERYAIEVTGDVGQTTRAKLNELLEEYSDEIAGSGWDRVEFLYEKVGSFKDGSLTVNWAPNAELPQTFPMELVLAISSQETGLRFNFNNELVSFDWGRGIMQITSNGYVGAGSGITNSNVTQCQNRNDQSSCYHYYSHTAKGVEANIKDALHALGDKYRWAVNSEGEDELGITDEEMRWISTVQRYNGAIGAFDIDPKFATDLDNASSGDTSSIEKLQAEFEQNEDTLLSDPEHVNVWIVKTDADGNSIKWIMNDTVLDIHYVVQKIVKKEATILRVYKPFYLAHIGYRLMDNLKSDLLFPQLPVSDESLAQLALKFLAVANNVEWIKVDSPVEIRLYDSSGRITGLVNNEVIQGIPNSIYDEDNEAIMVFFPSDSHHYKVVGTTEGTYDLDATYTNDGEIGVFNSTDIPTSNGAVHEYTVDWEALSQGRQGVNVQIDFNGDGTFELNIATGSTFTSVSATIDFDPDTLNLKSKGKWITCYIELPDKYNVGEINVNTVRLWVEGNQILAEGKPTEIGDYDGDGVSDLMLKFDRAKLIEFLKSTGHTSGDVSLTVNGQVGDAIFEGEDTIRVIGTIDKGMAPAKPTEFALFQNFSNPFNPDTWIPYQLAEDVDVTIRIYSAASQLVRTLDLGHKLAGFYTTKEKAAYWDGRNERGEEVTSGVYFIVMRAGEFTATRKMLMLK